MASVALPPPAVERHPLLQIMQKRHTSREFADRSLERQTVSDLLWAAYGINRPKEGKRTAPSAHDWQYIDIFVVDAEGLYRFDPRGPALDLLKQGDIRALTGLQEYPAHAPLNLVYVVDERKIGGNESSEVRALFAASTAGAIMQNVYLFCAAMNLNVGVRADINRKALHAAMGLASAQKILLAQSVGYPPTMALLQRGLKALLGS